MKLYIVDNFKIGIKRLIDERTNVKTLEELNNLEKDFLPYGLMIYCEEDNTLYQYSNQDKFVPLVMSVEQMFFEYNEETDKYDIPIYVHNPKVFEHPIEQIEDWLGILKSKNIDAKSLIIDNDLILDYKTWNTIKLNKYDDEKFKKHQEYIDNSLTSIIKPTYKRVSSIEEMIDVGNFYILEDPRTGDYLIHVVAENGEVLSISSTNIDMSDFQPRLAETLETRNKYIVDAINELNTNIKDQEKAIGITDDNKGVGLNGEPSTISEFIGDVYTSYLKSVGTLDTLTTYNKTSLTNAINEIDEKVGRLEDIGEFVRKDNIVNSINALYQSAKILPGSILMYGGSTAPEGFLLCDGSAIDPAVYPDLYDVIGSTYGMNADGTFNVPNLNGTVIAGKSPISSSRWYQLGKKHGSKNITLSRENMPSHRHVFNGSHKHGEGQTVYTDYHPGFSVYNSYSNNGRSGSTHDNAFWNTRSEWHYHPSESSYSETHNHTCYYSGGDPHNNVMPYIVLNYIIKY
jgi:microcystin-dependent protein